MTPEALASINAEHSHQRALFAWANVAERIGFALAWDQRTYEGGAIAQFLEGGVNRHVAYPVPELRWLHAIPNGGYRDKATAGKLKAEGVKRGVSDMFLPLPMKGPIVGGSYQGQELQTFTYAGLYVEMKRPRVEKEGVRKPRIIAQSEGELSAEQTEFVQYARQNGYAVSVCFDWVSAAQQIQLYIETVRNNR